MVAVFQKNRVRFAAIFCMAFVLVGVFYCARASFALSMQDEIRTAYRDILNREPTAKELEAEKSGYPGFDFLKRKLNKLAERRDAIRSIYQRALKRYPRSDELNFMIRAMVAGNDMREQLYSSQERVLALKDLYVGLLGREPEGSALDFYFKTRSAFSDIRETLNGSAERREAVKKAFDEELGREPIGEEMDFYIKEAMFLHPIKLDLRTLDSDTVPSVSNLRAGISETSAVILFDADKKVSAAVEYGVSEFYGYSVTEEDYLFSHGIVLSGLVPRTVYHYRIIAADRSGNRTIETGKTFLTKEAVYVSGVPFRQKEGRWMDGPACVQMLLEYAGLEESQKDIAKETLVTLPILNVSFAFPDRLVEYLAFKGVEGEEAYAAENPDKADLDYLKAKLGEGRPAIVKVQTGFSEHYRILTGYSDESGEFIFSDPSRSSPNFKVKYEKFLEEWSSSPIYNPLYKNWSFFLKQVPDRHALQ